MGLAACLVALPASGSAQRAPALAGTPTPDHASAALQVFLMTFGPGRQVWERFGHNAIWIHDPVDGTDEAYNYGLFDFHQENFLLRFVRGQMWYWMAGFPAARYVAQYERDNRSVWVQELELSHDAKVELERFLRWNAEPEHRYYHYDYYRDNCSTRVRDAVDRVLSGRPAPPDRHRARGDDVPVPHSAAHGQRSAHLHRPPRRPRGRGGSADYRLGGDVPAAQDAGLGPNRVRARARRCPRAARAFGAHHLRVVGLSATRGPAVVGADGISQSGSPSGARPWCSRAARERQHWPASGS